MNAVLIIFTIILSSFGSAKAQNKLNQQPHPVVNSQTTRLFDELSKIEKPINTAPQNRVEYVLQAANGQMSTQNDVWYANGYFLSVIQSEKIMVSFQPHNNELMTNLGWMLENVHKNNEALQVYQNYHAQFPNDPDSAFSEAFFEFNRKNYSKVIKLLEPSMNTQLHPEPNAYRTLAHAYEKTKQFDQALRVWNTYIKLVPDDLTAIANQKRDQAAIDKNKTKSPPST